MTPAVGRLAPGRLEGRPGARRVVVVLGMHRSGTSLLTNCLAFLGIPFGDRLIQPRADNERGFWEHAGIVARHEEILCRLDRAWPGAKVSLPYPEDWWRRADLAAARQGLAAILAEELAAGDGLFGFKDPRTCRLMPLWRELIAEAGAEMAVVLGLRHPAEIAQSLSRRDGTSPAQAHLLWLQHVLEPFAWLDRMPPAADFDDLLHRPEDTARKLVAELDIPWRGDEASLRHGLAEILAPDLRHHRAGGAGECPPLLLEIHELLKISPAGAPLPARLRQIMAGFAEHGRVFAPWAEQLDRLTDPRLARRPLDLALLRDDERARWRRRFASALPGPGPNHPAPAPLPAGPATHGSLSICIVTADLAGPVRNGGIGTAYGALAEALAGAGHRVTVLYTIAPYSESGPLEHWIGHWRSKGVELVPLDPPAPLAGAGFNQAMAWAVHRWLAGQRFDLVHGHEWRGVLAHALLARHHGLAHGGTTFVVGTHSPLLWHAIHNGRPIDAETLADDALERSSVALADHVVSPSAYLLGWMAAEGWRLPERTHVQPNLLPALRPDPAPDDAARPIDEVVFFGRLERRKGLELFLAALELLPSPPRVVFLGKHSDIGAGRSSHDLLGGRQVVDGLGSAEALAWLAGGRRLAVIASLAENSPYTVLECLDAGIPLLASRVGGIPELIHPDDRERVLFEPRPAALAAALARCLAAGAVAPARAAFSGPDNHRRWLAWHASLERAPPPEPPLVDALEGPLVALCAGPGAEPAAAALRAALPPEGEALWLAGGAAPPGWRLVDVPPRPGHEENWRAAAAAATTAPYLLLVDAAAEPVPGGIAALVAAALAAGSDAVAPFLDTPAGPWPALGEAVAARAAGRPLDGGVLLVRRAVLLEDLDADDLAAALVLSGRVVTACPLPCFRRPGAPPAAGPSAGALAAVPAVLRPALQLAAAPPPPAPPAPAPPASPAQDDRLTVLAAERDHFAALAEARAAETAALRASTSWRLTAPLRGLRRILGS